MCDPAPKRNPLFPADPFPLTSGGRGQRSEVRGQRSEVRDQRSLQLPSGKRLQKKSILSGWIIKKTVKSFETVDHRGRDPAPSNWPPEVNGPIRIDISL